jgi:hypothetical protein
MLPNFIVEDSVRREDGTSMALDISGDQGSTLLLTLGDGTRLPGRRRMGTETARCFSAKILLRHLRHHCRSQRRAGSSLSPYSVENEPMGPGGTQGIVRFLCFRGQSCGSNGNCGRQLVSPQRAACGS